MIAFMLSNIQDVGVSMLLRFWRLSGRPRTFYERSRSSFPYNLSLFLAFGRYGRSRSLPRPRSPLANDAINELDKAYSLIEIAAKNNRRAGKALAILDRMREKAHRALAAVRTSTSHPQPDGVKQEEIEDDFVVFAGRRRVFRPGSNATPSQQAAPTPQDPLPQDEHAGESLIGVGEWLARQEEYVGYDPHYVSAIEPPSAPHDQHQQQQHQQRQYGYAPEQPQYTLEAVPPPHYMTAPYASYAPPPHPPHQLLHPHNLHPSSHNPGMGQPSHELHTDELADMRRDYAVTVRAPPAGAGPARVRSEWVAHERDMGVVHAVTVGSDDVPYSLFSFRVFLPFWVLGLGSPPGPPPPLQLVSL
ncbi:hypothetical protein EDB83DRAFT_1652149 [Lactarius deliciosus]|nr:hypothetical protein EDB83DRAFT_1652149 [Lactarius deliciosus]